MRPILVVAGITASGKSSVAIKLAHKYDAEIISADSVAVYNELTIGSAKPTLEEQKSIKHHLINIRSYDESYDVAQFQKEARSAIDEIQSRGKNVIVVGGTGLYLKALLYDYRFNDETEIKVNGYQEMKDSDLYTLLLKKDPSLEATIHPNNRKRIIRALEAFDEHGVSQETRTENRKDIKIIPSEVVFLSGPRDVLYERMNQRVDTMIASGLEHEVASLYARDKDLFSKRSIQAIGYREFEPYFLGNTKLEDVIEQIKIDTRRFSKRQWTWFKHQLPNYTVDITENDPFDAIDCFIKEKHGFFSL